MKPSNQAKGVSWHEVQQDSAGQRIDNFLLGRLKGVPRSYVYRVLRKGEVRVNKGRIKADYRLKVGDMIRIPPVRMVEREPNQHVPAHMRELITAAVVYEDERLMVLNKPSGLAVHGGSGLSLGVIEALRLMRPDERQLELVHRLDRDTSGCLLISKRRSSLRMLHDLIRENRIHKRYLALLAGRWRKGAQTVTAPLLKHTLKSGERMVRVDAAGMPAESRFSRLERFSHATLVEVALITGRTHQIRVHSAWMGHPILGDDKYGDPMANKMMRAVGLKRLFLHAASLSFRWPGETEEKVYRAALPEELEKVIATIKNENEV